MEGEKRPPPKGEGDGEEDVERPVPVWTCRESPPQEDVVVAPVPRAADGEQHLTAADFDLLAWVNRDPNAECRPVTREMFYRYANPDPEEIAEFLFFPDKQQSDEEAE